MGKAGRTAIAALAIVLLVAIGYGNQRRIPAAPAHAFDVCIVQAGGKAPRQAWNDAVLSAVARQLSDTERASLEEALGVAATRWEARANPMLEDLEDGDPDASLAKWLKTAPAFVRTAEASAKMRLCAPDGFCVVPRAKNAACPAESLAPKTADEEDRARFVLWAWGHALRFRAKTPEEARAAAARLRERARSSRAIAIVMTEDDPEVTKSPPFADMRQRWRKVGALSRIVRKEPVAPPPDTFAVEEAPNEVIVLPRLEVLSGGNADEVVRGEVNAIAPSLEPATTRQPIE